MRIPSSATTKHPAAITHHQRAFLFRASARGAGCRELFIVAVRHNKDTAQSQFVSGFKVAADVRRRLFGKLVFVRASKPRSTEAFPLQAFSLQRERSANDPRPLAWAGMSQTFVLRVRVTSHR